MQICHVTKLNFTFEKTAKSFAEIKSGVRQQRVNGKFSLSDMGKLG